MTSFAMPVGHQVLPANKRCGHAVVASCPASPLHTPSTSLDNLRSHDTFKLDATELARVAGACEKLSQSQQCDCGAFSPFTFSGDCRFCHGPISPPVLSEPGRGLSRGSTDACGCGAYAPLRAGGECRLCFGAALLPAAKAAATSNSSQLHEYNFDSDYNPQPTAAPSRAECESHELYFD